METPMEKPRDKIYFCEPLFNGKTSEQIFQEKLQSGKIFFVGKALSLRENREYLEVLHLDGKPMKSRLKSVSLFEVDEFMEEGLSTHYHRNPVLQRTWTPEEWTPEEKKRVETLVWEKRNNGHSSS